MPKITYLDEPKIVYTDVPENETVESKYIMSPTAMPHHMESPVTYNPQYRSREFSFKENLKGGAAAPKERARYYTDLLVQKYGPEEGPKRIQLTDAGNILVKGQSGKWQHVGDGMGAEDIIGGIPAAMEVGLGTLGGALGLAGGAPLGPGSIAVGAAGETAGSAAGQFGGTLLTGAISRRINPEYAESPMDSMSKAQKESLDSAMWSMGSALGFEVFRTAKGFLRGFGPAIRPEDAVTLLKNHNEYLNAVKQVNAAADVQNLKLGVVPRLPHEHAKLALVLRQGEERARQERGYDALEAYLNPTPPNPMPMGVEGISRGPGQPVKPDAMRTAGEGPEMTTELMRQERIGGLDKSLAMLRSRLEKSSRELDSLPRTAETAPKIAEIVTTRMQEAKGTRDQIYKLYQELIGQADNTFTSKHQVPISDSVLALKKEIKELEKSGADIGGSSLFKGLKKGETVDLAALDYRIKLLNDRLYDHSRGMEIPFSKRTAETVLAELRNMRNAYVDQFPSIATVLSQAEEAHSLYKQTYRSGFIEKLVQETPNGDYVLTDPGMVAGILNSGDGQAIRQLAVLGKEHPGLQGELQRLAMAHYRSIVMPQGTDVVDKAAHDAYMADGGWYEKIAPFFSEKDKNLIKVQGGLAKSVLDTEKKLQSVQQEWAKLHKGKFKELNAKNPESFVKEIFAKGPKKMSPSAATYLLGQMERFVPERIPAYKAGIRQALVDRLRTSGGSMNSARLTSMLAENGPVLKAIFGPEYIKDLETASLILRHEATMAKQVPDTKGPALEEGAGVVRRVLYGPLSSTGYRFNIFAGLRGTHRANEIYEVMTDPEALNKWIKFYNRRSYQQIATMGAGLIAEDQVTDE